MLEVRVTAVIDQKKSPRQRHKRNEKLGRTVGHAPPGLEELVLADTVIGPWRPSYAMMPSGIDIENFHIYQKY